MKSAKDNRDRSLFVSTKTTKELLSWCNSVIETAVERGDLHCRVRYSLNDECIKILEGKGYSVTDTSYDMETSYVIEW